MSDEFVKQENRKSISVSKIVTVLYMEYAPDFVFAGESHDFWEFAYIDKGSMIFTADGREFLLQGGEMVFHKPNEFHRLEARGLSAPNISVVSFVCASRAMKYFEDKIFKLNGEERKILSAMLREGLAAFAPLTPRPPVMGMREREDAPFGARQMTFNLLEQFLVALSRRNERSIRRESRSVGAMDEEDYPEEIRRVLGYMDRNLDKKLGVRDFAEAFSMSESALKKLFSLYARRGVIDCFNDRKLRRAKELIREHDLNFTEISEELGFSSVHYFSRLFKLRTGMSPSEYRVSVKC